MKNILFLAHLSWKLKWAFLIYSLVVHHLSLCELLYFRLLLQSHWANFNQTWHKSSFGGGDSKLFKWKDFSCPRGNNSKRVKIQWKFLKISRTRRPILLKLGTNHPCLKGILNCWLKEPSPLQGGDSDKDGFWSHCGICVPVPVYETIKTEVPCYSRCGTRTLTAKSHEI
jgi:hypothetical protein